MTNSMIDNIRASLGRTLDKANPQGILSEPRPTIYPSRIPGSTDAEVDRFLEEIRKVSGVAQKLSPSNLAVELKTLVTEHNIHKATLWETPFLEQLGVGGMLKALGVELISPRASKYELAQCDLGVTEADFLLPETGTLVLSSSDAKPRTVSLLPRIHLAIVRPEMLRADMHQVFAEAKDSCYLVFITGPSRTADIELTVTLGVHGPHELFVWMMEK